MTMVSEILTRFVKSTQLDAVANPGECTRITNIGRDRYMQSTLNMKPQWARALAGQTNGFAKLW